jgi:hypothetical protein
LGTPQVIRGSAGPFLVQHSTRLPGLKNGSATIPVWVASGAVFRTSQAVASRVAAASRGIAVARPVSRLMTALFALFMFALTAAVTAFSAKNVMVINRAIGRHR